MIKRFKLWLENEIENDLRSSAFFEKFLEEVENDEIYNKKMHELRSLNIKVSVSIKK